ncbi:MAG: NusA-like transcription termination signal-binding factor [Candidatus Aenigmatarchaeota archaeon]|nr:MAG: NusA-like transcription termination signal-binding factor [Candidatus Aenigmarchaeota archaeon]
MSVRDFDSNTINTMNLFEKHTHVSPRDCVLNENVYFVVEEGKAGLAIGKGGANIKKLQNLLKKRVRVFEHNANVVEFVKNMIPEAERVEANGTRVTVVIQQQDRGRVIGKGGENVKMIREILRRNSNVEELEVK